MPNNLELAPSRLKRKLLDSTSESESSSSKTAKSTKLSKSHKTTWANSEYRRRKNASSALERLPLELLAKIFIESMEISLPQASHYIGKALSSEWVYQQYLLRVGTLRMAETNRMMECRFFTNQWLDKNSLALSEQIHNVMDRHYNPTEDALPMQEMVVLPIKMFCSPWTRQKIVFYRTLRHYTHRPEPFDPSRTAAELRGLQDAIAERNVEAVCDLLEIYKFTGMSKSCTINQRSPLPQYLLREAVMNCGCDEVIVVILLLHGLHLVVDPNRSRLGIDYMDVELWMWAEENGTKGRFLIATLKLMNDISQGELAAPGLPEIREFIFDRTYDILARFTGEEWTPDYEWDNGDFSPSLRTHQQCITDTINSLFFHWLFCKKHTPVSLRKLYAADHKSNNAT